MVVAFMETSTPIEDSFLETFEVSSSTASAIQISWHIRTSNLPFVEGFRVHYQKVASTYIQYGPKLHATDNEYEIGNLVADTYYKVCLVVYRNDSNPFRECTDASTTNWEVPVSIGSSIGAVLALSMIVFIVLLSRCQLPIKYRRKKSQQLQKYDTISSNYHDDQYEFSETGTHGPDDDYTSEYDHDDENYFEIQPSEPPRRPKQFLPDKPGIPNGLGKSHVHPHTFGHHHNQHRNSLSRIQYPQSHQHHHGRQFRAYSIQADGNVCFFNQPCSPLAKEPRKNSLGHDIRDTDDMFHDSSIRKASAMKEFTPVKFDIASALKTCSPSTQAFTFIDEIPENVSKSSVSRSNDSKEAFMKSKEKETDNLLITDIDFDDMSKFGAAGGAPPTETSNKTIEMSASHGMLALPESVSFDEHTV